MSLFYKSSISYGKGRKVRVVPLRSQTAVILQKYLNVWQLDPTRRPDDPVFVNHQGMRLTRPGVNLHSK